MNDKKEPQNTSSQKRQPYKSVAIILGIVFVGFLTFDVVYAAFVPPSAPPTTAAPTEFISGSRISGSVSNADNATNVTGVVGVPNGGTGTTTLTGVVVGNGASAFTTKTNPLGAFVGTTDTQTLTNKTISKASNTLTGVAGSGANSDITSITGLTAPLSASQGGTGLSSVGAVNNVLTSNGTSWVSSAPAGASQWTTSGTSIYYNTGNVGIGTLGPSYKLHVNGGDIYASGYVRGNSGLCIGGDCRNTWPASGVETDTLQSVTNRGNSTSNQIQASSFFDFNNTTYYLDPSFSGYSMYLAGSIGMYGALFDLNNTSYNVQPSGTTNLNAVTGSLLRFSTLYDRFNSSYYFQPNGNSILNGYMSIGTGANASYRIELPNSASTSGQGRANAWVIYSSRRWKENIKPMENALSNVLKLQGVQFDWKKENGGTHGIGMIAEDVGKILPELVTYEDNGVDAAGLDYAKLSAVLVEAVKEQQKQIEELKIKVKELENR